MGKGTIISHLGDGEYQVEINYTRDAYDQALTRLEGKISAYATAISEAEADSIEQRLFKLQKLSCEKRKEYLENNMPDDENINAWCADLTKDLAGEIGLIEVPGESVNFNVQPGHEDNAVYDSARDGQLMPSLIMTPAQNFYNLAMLPGWQKWMPTFRYATITSITGDLADVTLDSTESTQQNINVNQDTSLSNVDIEYMECNGSAFAVGDEVLIKFTSQDWNNPKIIGFKDNPEECGFRLKCSFNGHTPVSGGQSIILRYTFSDSSEQEDTYTIGADGINTENIQAITDPISGEVVDPEIFLSSSGGLYYYYYRNDEDPDFYYRMDTIREDIPIYYPPGDTIAWSKTLCAEMSSVDGSLGYSRVTHLSYPTTLLNCPDTTVVINGGDEKAYEIDYVGIQQTKITIVEDYTSICWWDESPQIHTFDIYSQLDGWVFPGIPEGEFWTKVAYFTHIPSYGYEEDDIYYVTNRLGYAEDVSIDVKTMLITCTKEGKNLILPSAVIKSLFRAVSNHTTFAEGDYEPVVHCNTGSEGAICTWQEATFSTQDYEASHFN